MKGRWTCTLPILQSALIDGAIMTGAGIDRKGPPLSERQKSRSSQGSSQDPGNGSRHAQIVSIFQYFFIFDHSIELERREILVDRLWKSALSRTCTGSSEQWASRSLMAWKCPARKCQSMCPLIIILFEVWCYWLCCLGCLQHSSWQRRVRIAAKKPDSVIKHRPCTLSFELISGRCVAAPLPAVR